MSNSTICSLPIACESCIHHIRSTFAVLVCFQCACTQVALSLCTQQWRFRSGSHLGEVGLLGLETSGAQQRLGAGSLVFIHEAGGFTSHFNYIAAEGLQDACCCLGPWTTAASVLLDEASLALDEGVLAEAFRPAATVLAPRACIGVLHSTDAQVEVEA
jgi:hypothetical protein